MEGDRSWKFKKKRNKMKNSKSDPLKHFAKFGAVKKIENADGAPKRSIDRSTAMETSRIEILFLFFSFFFLLNRKKPSASFRGRDSVKARNRVAGATSSTGRKGPPIPSRPSSNRIDDSMITKLELVPRRFCVLTQFNLT